MSGRPTAGLPLSVGNAPLAVRLLIAIPFAATSILCIAIGRIVAAPRGGALVAAFLAEPIGIVGLIAVAFILAPRSRFGTALDEFIPRLREPRIAVTTTVGIIAASALLIFA